MTERTGDLAEHFAIDATEQDTAPTRPLARIPVLVRVGDVQPEAVEWLWPSRVAIGKNTLIAGDPGLGKSFLTLDMSARVSRGTSWPDAPDAENPAGSVVLLSAEDDIADTIRPRLDAAGADCDRITVLQAVVETDVETGVSQEESFNLKYDLPALEQAVEQARDCRLIVIDPITAYLGGVDSHKNAELRGLLAPLALFASRRRVAIVCVTHLRKAEGPAMYRALGSLAFVAAARAVWAVAADQNDRARRLFIPVKQNLAADVTGLAYRIMAGSDGAPIVAWEPDPVTITADEALAAQSGRDGRRAERDAATDWLREALTDGPMPANDVFDQGRANGVTKPTLRRAADELGVRRRKCTFTGGWVWELPAGGGHEDAHVSTLGLALPRTRVCGSSSPGKRPKMLTCPK